MTAYEVRIGFQNLKKRKKALTMLMAEIEEERLQAENIHGLNLDKLNVKTSILNSTEELYIKCLDRIREIEKRFEAEIEKMMVIEDDLLSRMSKLSPQEYNVITHRYIFGYTILKTAAKLKYTEDGVKTVQKRAFKKMADF